jgi:uncharacterized protein
MSTINRNDTGSMIEPKAEKIIETMIESMIDVIKAIYEDADPAHDFSHIMRVFRNALIIGEREGADMQVLLLASLLHDAFAEPKNSKSIDSGTSQESQSDLRSDRKKAVDDLLRENVVSAKAREEVLYAVEVHRFSKGIVPKTLEAKILQDADRLDAMGAIGIARVFMTGGTLGRALYNPDDPFCRAREPDDGKWNLDHFYRKLLKLEAGMHTETARRMAKKRAGVLRKYLRDLEEEIGN